MDNVLHYVFKKFAKLRNKPGELLNLDVGEFEEMVNHLGLNVFLKEASDDIAWSFNMSVKFRVSNLNNDGF